MSDDSFWNAGNAEGWQAASDAYHEYETVTNDAASRPYVHRAKPKTPFYARWWFLFLCSIVIGAIAEGVARLIDWLHYLFA